MNEPISKMPPLIYPYHVCPKIRNFTTAILFHQQIAVSLAAWLSVDPINAFLDVGGRASQKKDRLENLFNFVLYQFDIVQEVAVKELNHLEPLGDKIARVCTVYPGTPEQYIRWEKHHESCLVLASASLHNVHILSAAITDFIFRVYELMLINDHDADKTLEELNRRAIQLGNENLLLAECALNRYTLPSTNRGTWITDSEQMLTILASIGKSDFCENEPTQEYRSEGLANTLFDTLLSPYVPRLDADGINVVNKLMDERIVELTELRRKVITEANTLIEESPSSRLLKSAIQASISRMESEIRDIVAVNRTDFKDLCNRLLEDRIIIATLAGFLYSTVENSPLAFTAAMGIAALSSVGANLVKTRNASKRRIEDSPFAFIHYLNTESK